jgi:hypothetical protein
MIIRLFLVALAALWFLACECVRSPNPAGNVQTAVSAFKRAHVNADLSAAALAAERLESLGCLKPGMEPHQLAALLGSSDLETGVYGGVSLGYCPSRIGDTHDGCIWFHFAPHNIEGPGPTRFTFDCWEAHFGEWR